MSIQVSREELTRIVVAIDPAATANEGSDDTGIVVVARGPHQPSTCHVPFCPGHGYVLDDRTCHVLPVEWAKTAIAAYDHWQADRIVAETNNGGDMVGTVIHSVRAGVPYAKVTATRGKRLRAEPCSALYEQGRVHHIGSFPELEVEQNTWTPDASWSPNRLDALVWGLTYLGLTGGQGDAFMTFMKDDIANRADNPVPEELRRLPKHDHEFEKRTAAPKCKGGQPHRFMEYGDGTYQCAQCGGFLDGGSDQ